MDKTLRTISGEAEHAALRFGPPTSTHESLGVLLEEFDELKESIHTNSADRIYKEAVQVAAVAYRLALEVAMGSPAFLDRSGLKRKAA